MASLDKKKAKKAIKLLIEDFRINYQKNNWNDIKD